MDYNSTQDYIKLLAQLAVNENITHDIVSSLMGYVKHIYQSDLDNQYSKPMLLIGLYIALASLCCILAMAADLLHGLKSRKLWFPCKYFSINAATLTVIGVAMKLTVDLSGSMPGDVDQVAKLGSMAFMCTMMANLLPSLATMDNNELLTNTIALGILVITLVVNICIQIETGVISYKEDARLLKTVAKKYDLESLGIHKDRNTILAIVYVTLLMVLWIMHVCSSLAILKSKQIIESKYQQHHETATKDVQPSKGKILTVEKLQQLVSRYWIMSGSGSPQFIIACFVTTTASGVICTLTTILHTLTISWSVSAMLKENYDSDYKWSMVVILIAQFIGVVLGTIAPFSRCFATLSFKVSIKSIFNHKKVFIVESYWTQKLYDWKQGSIRFRHHKVKVAFIALKNRILNFCIEFQMGVVIVCKILALIPFFFMICVFYCFHCLKWLFQSVFRSPDERTENLEQRCYILQLEDEMELAENTLEDLSKSMNRLIKKGGKKQLNNLKNLIKGKATPGFQGVKKFDDDQYVPYLSSKVEYQDCWSLSLVTLTTVAITLPNSDEAEVDSLLRSVREGLEYVILVEENLNGNDDYVSIQKVAEMLWQEVDVCKKWLGEELQHITSQVNTVSSQDDKLQQIVELFLEKAKNKMKDEASNDFKNTSICAYSMCRVTKTIIDEKEGHKDLFVKLSSRIADIMAACLTNVPQVIAMKCHTGTIEKREAYVQAAARLLGETKEIINTLQDHDIPCMNPDDLPFINKWRDFLSAP